jgi:thymidylate synthase (FAD)
MAGIPEEDARYMKPQGTETKIIIGMNARSLLDFWGFRCCFKAAWEIRAMAYEMLRLVKEATQETPEIFAKAGARCQQLGYCPENEGQCREMRLKEITLDELMAMKDLTTPY